MDEVLGEVEEVQGGGRGCDNQQDSTYGAYDELQIASFYQPLQVRFTEFWQT